MILTVRKPDMIGNTMWQFRHGKVDVSAPIKDEDWLTRYHGRKIDIRPGDAMRCWVRFIYSYDANGRLKGQDIEIERVYEIIYIMDHLPDRLRRNSVSHPLRSGADCATNVRL